MRRSLAWLVAVPAMLTGSQVAHALAYRLVYPQAHVRVTVLSSTGHGYLAQLPLVLGAAAAVAFVSLALTALDAARGRHARALPAWAFAVLPPLAFVGQEVLELSLRTGTLAWHAIFAPTFLPGLVLQLPFALAAYLGARFLLRAAERLGRLLADRPAGAFVDLPSPLSSSPVLRSPALLRPVSRGPPLVAAS